jgi:hypothetical protein
VAPAGSERGVQFRFVDEAIAPERATHGLDCGRQEIGHPVLRTEANEERSVLDVLKAGAPGELIQTLRKPDIIPNTGEDLLQNLGEAVPGGMRRVALQRADVGILERDDATRACECNRLADEIRGPAYNAGDEARMDEFEGPARQTRAVSIALDERHVAEAPVARQGPSLFEKDWIGVEGDNASGWPCADAQQFDDKGGKSRSKKKLQAIAANLAKARSKRWAPPAGGKTIHEAYAEQVAAGLTRVKETK